MPAFLYVFYIIGCGRVLLSIKKCSKHDDMSTTTCQLVGTNLSVHKGNWVLHKGRILTGYYDFKANMSTSSQESLGSSHVIFYTNFVILR